MKKNNKGFTLMEMLIVIVIIVILVALVMPTYRDAFSSARKAADESNLRNAYGMLLAETYTESEDKIVVSEKLQSDGEEISFPNCDPITTQKGARIKFSTDSEGKIVWEYN